MRSIHGNPLAFAMAANRSTEQLWLQFLADPSQWWDNRHIKRNETQPDFKHKRSLDTLWIASPETPSWVCDKVAAMDCLARIRATHLCFNEGEDEMLQRLCKERKIEDVLRWAECVAQLAPAKAAPRYAYVALLKECARRKLLAEGKRVHALIAQSEYDSDVFLANSLIDMYAKCGSAPDAHAVFNSMPEHNVFSWTAVISAYAASGDPREAIALYDEMEAASVAPDRVLLAIALKACARAAALEQGKRIHSRIVEVGFHLDMVVQSALVDMYAKCGCLDDARRVFDGMTERDVVSWTAMIAGYVWKGLGMEALALCEQMEAEGIQADKRTCLYALKACASIGELARGRWVHSVILRRGFCLDMVVLSALVDMYVKCGCLESAREVFEGMGERNVVSWTAMIAGYAQAGCVSEAVALYRQMGRKGVRLNGATLVCMLRACAGAGALEQGKQIHAAVLEHGLHLDVAVQNTLVDMYAKCGCIEAARTLFDGMCERSMVSWTAIIAGYAQCGLGAEALTLYERMAREGVQADKVTFVAVLKACAGIRVLEYGKQIHALAREKGFHFDITVQNALIDMYAKCGFMEGAREVFGGMSERDVVSWNAMIAGHVQNGLAMDAITLYERMEEGGVTADAATLSCVLKACANIGALDHGRRVHSLILRMGFHPDLIIQNTLVDMYAKCGCLHSAREVFDSMGERDVFSWTAIIAGYAESGLGADAVALYERMEQEGVQPNDVTYVCVLSACRHAGLVSDGLAVFERMHRCHGVTPGAEHYSCVVDLLGRAGLLAEASDLIAKMPIQPTGTMWMSLLDAARNAGDADTGQRTFDYAARLDPESMDPYLPLMNIYAHLGQMDKVAGMRERVRSKDWQTMPGFKSIGECIP